MTYFVGIDAGGSKTRCVVTNEVGDVLGIGRAGNGNYQLDKEQAEHNIRQALSEALREAGLTERQIAFAWFGLAGADREADYEILSAMIEPFNIQQYDISGDTVIALRAGTLHSHGVVVICGSGVNCAGFDRAGKFYQCGGFGYMYGDFGGGGGLAVEVFRSVIRAWDGREEATILTSMLLETLGYTSVEKMFHDYLDHNKYVPLDVAKLLFPAARQDDAVAKQILEHQGKELGLAAKAVIHRLGMQKDTFDLVLSGSVLTQNKEDFIRKPIGQIVLPAAPGCSIITLAVEPVVGAILLAMEKAGYTVSPQTYTNLCNIKQIKMV